MFLQILHTLARAAAVFSTLFIGFGITFHILFGHEAKAATLGPAALPHLSCVQAGRGYDPWGISILHSVMMMMGDWNFKGSLPPS